MTIFGVEWNELRLEHVERFLADAGPEPLLWEAKGTELRRDVVRVQVCGFANSHDGGFLVLGANQTEGGWALSGVKFDHDPPTWITDVVGGGNVTPYPDGLDTRAWETTDGYHVAVVRVPPVATPPCMTHGRVYERVSGKTIAVTEPLRLAALFERGDQARALAQAKAQRLAVAIIRRYRGHLASESATQFGLGLAAAGYLPDISSRLFSRQFESGAISSMQTVLTHDQVTRTHVPPIRGDVSQSSRSFESYAHDQLGYTWTTWITWDGAVAIYWTHAGREPEIEGICSGPLREASHCLEEILSMLGPQGPRYMQLEIVGPRFHLDENVPPDETTTVTRGPVDPGVGDTVIASIARELRRATGEMVYEPGEL